MKHSEPIEIELTVTLEQLGDMITNAVKILRGAPLGVESITFNLSARRMRFRAPATGWAGTVSAAPVVDSDRDTWSFLGDHDPEQFDSIEDMPDTSVADMLSAYQEWLDANGGHE